MVCYSLDKIMCQINSRNEAKERFILATAEEADFIFEIADIDCAFELDEESICFNKCFLNLGVRILKRRIGILTAYRFF